ncbi:MAG: hypothetical protein NBV63_03090 [Candidatus Pacebacteria bacterium]|nr:hypothetical protein [Candidatus Paceibacterota bacterium]
MPWNKEGMVHWTTNVGKKLYRHKKKATAAAAVVGTGVAINQKAPLVGQGRDISDLFDNDDGTGGTGDGGMFGGSGGGEGPLKFAIENPEWVVAGTVLGTIALLSILLMLRRHSSNEATAY